MQTLSVPYRISDPDRQVLDQLRRTYSSAVRQAYKASIPRKCGAMLSEKEVRTQVNARHRESGLGAWLLQCAVLEGRSLANRHPDGGIVFGGARNFERRAKGLISNEQWRRARLMPLFSQGKASERGNRVFRMDATARKATLRVASRQSDGKTTQTIVELDLIALRSKQGRLLRQVAILAHASDITLGVRIDDQAIYLVFDELDLRKLPEGTTLRQAKDGDIENGQARRKGRSRGQNYVPAKVGYLTDRPVHPDFKDPVQAKDSRRIGIDLNPQYIGLSVVELVGKDPANFDHVKLLDYHLIHFDPRHPSLNTKPALRLAIAESAKRVISMARAWHVGEIVLEQGLGCLRSSTGNRDLNARNNRWNRSWFHQSLTRRAMLAGIDIKFVPAAYSTTIGNLVFDAPDACASAAEIARRGWLDLKALWNAKHSKGDAPAIILPNNDKQEDKSQVSRSGREDKLGMFCDRAPDSPSSADIATPIISPVLCQHPQPPQELTTPLSPFLQALLPDFSPHHLPDRWKKMAGEALSWVQVHGIVKTNAAGPKSDRIGLRRPHQVAFLPGSLGPMECRGSQDPMPFLPGHEVARLGWKPRPGWVLRAHPRRPVCCGVPRPEGRLA